MKIVYIFNYLKAVFSFKCPKCHKGYIFKYKNPYRIFDTNKMVEHCAICNQKTELEVGFYYGTAYVSYALGVAFLIAYTVAWKIITNFKFLPDDPYVFKCLFSGIIILVLLQPIFMRLSRSLWLSWFVPYDPQFKSNHVDK